jgi:hypothetical protein
MPITTDPSLTQSPLGIKGAAGAPPFNPLAGLEAATAIQNYARTGAETQDIQNRIAQFNASFAARQRAGAIAATSPDLATAAERMGHDDQVAAFAPELAQTMANVGQVLQTTAGMRQDQAFAGARELTKTLFSVAVNRPQMLDKAVQMGMGMIPPANQAAVGRYAQGLMESLTDGLRDANGNIPPMAAGEITKRLIPALVAAGLDSRQLADVLGTVPPGVNVVPNATASGQSGLVAQGGAIGGGLPSQGPSGNSNPPSPSSPVISSFGPDTVTKDAMARVVPQVIDIKNDLDQRAKEAISIQTQIDSAQGILNAGTKTGPGQPTKQKITSLMYALGASDDVMKALGENPLADSQALSARLTQLMVQQLKSTTGTGKPYTAEFERWAADNPNFATTNEGINKMFDFAKKITGMTLAEQQDFNRAQNASMKDLGVDSELARQQYLSQHPARWNQKLIDSGQIRDTTKPFDPKSVADKQQLLDLARRGIISKEEGNRVITLHPEWFKNGK